MLRDLRHQFETTGFTHQQRYRCHGNSLLVGF